MRVLTFFTVILKHDSLSTLSQQFLFDYYKYLKEAPITKIWDSSTIYSYSLCVTIIFNSLYIFSCNLLFSRDSHAL